MNDTLPPDRECLHQFMVSLWLHFFREPVQDTAASWKECAPRRRRHFFRAPLQTALRYADTIVARGPEQERAPLAAVVNSRLTCWQDNTRQQTGATCSALQTTSRNQARSYAVSVLPTSTPFAKC